MSIDLDALKLDLTALRVRGDVAAALTATTAELYRLIAEVERLRAEVERERADAVAWLRDVERMHETNGSRLVASVMSRNTDAIERGEHRREGEP